MGPPINSRLPLLRAQSPLPSKPINPPSKCTTVVSSLPDVDPTLTTVYSPSAMVTKTELTTSSSRTPGVLAGVTLAMLRWPSTNAVSLNLPLTHLPELFEPHYEEKFVYGVSIFKVIYQSYLLLKIK